MIVRYDLFNGQVKITIKKVSKTWDVISADFNMIFIELSNYLQLHASLSLLQHR